MTMPADPTQQVTPPAQPVLPNNGNQAFTQADLDAAIERGRKESNDRLYSRLEEQKTRLEQLQQQSTEFADFKKQMDDAKAAADTEQARLAQEAIDADKSAKELIQEQEKKWNDRFTQLEHDNKVKDALLAKEKQARDMDAYRDRRIHEEQEPQFDQNGQQVSDGIAPQLIGYIRGDSEDEIERSIVTAKQNTTSILEGIRAARIAQAQAAPGVSVAAGGIPPVDPSGNIGTREYSAEEIAAMPLDSPILQQLRQQHGMGRATPQRGMFG